MTAITRWSTLGAFFVFLALSIVNLLLPFTFLFPDKFFAIAFISLFFGLAATACARGIEVGRMVVLMWSGLIASGLTVVLSLAIAVATPRFLDEREAMIVTVPVMCWAVWSALVAALHFDRPRSLVVTILRYTAMSFGVSAGVLLSFGAAVQFSFSRSTTEQTFFKGLGVSLVLMLLAAIAAFVVNRARQINLGVEPEVERIPFSAVCPRCDREGAFHTGGDACGNCGLKIKVTLT